MITTDVSPPWHKAEHSWPANSQISCFYWTWSHLLLILISSNKPLLFLVILNVMCPIQAMNCLHFMHPIHFLWHVKGCKKSWESRTSKGWVLLRSRSNEVVVQSRWASFSYLLHQWKVSSCVHCISGRIRTDLCLYLSKVHTYALQQNTGCNVNAHSRENQENDENARRVNSLSTGASAFQLNFWIIM